MVDPKENVLYEVKYFMSGIYFPPRPFILSDLVPDLADNNSSNEDGPMNIIDKEESPKAQIG